MFGKKKCKILKEIRQKIADENDIPYVTRECTYQGECSGTCPRCEQELRYLEQQLERRQRLGKAVAVTALAASMSLTVAGCVPPFIQPTAGEVMMESTEPEVTEDLMGEPTESGEPIPWKGLVEGDPQEIIELEGDVAYIPEDSTGTEYGLPVETMPEPVNE